MRSVVYLGNGAPHVDFVTLLTKRSCRRYLQSQGTSFIVALTYLLLTAWTGLFTVPTRIILFVAPINALLNYLLVWGPPPIRMGFIGAPIATAVSYNVLALSTVIYAFFFVPKTAWHPLTMQMFGQLGLLMQLGWAGVGEYARS
jgi:Na+-driven multidrug efflux pump